MNDKMPIVPMGEHPVIDFFKDNSRSQEKFAEYGFLHDLILVAARNNKKIGISRSDFDAFGFDVLLDYEGQFYPIQLKAVNGKALTWDVHKEFLKKTNCRVLIIEVIAKQDIISTKYKLLKKENVAKVISSLPKKKHIGKCKVNKGDLKDISNNLLVIFD